MMEIPNASAKNFDDLAVIFKEKSDGTNIKNLDLIQQLDNALYNKNITFIHINSHQPKPHKDDPTYELWYGNKMADKLATDAANLAKNQLTIL